MCKQQKTISVLVVISLSFISDCWAGNLSLIEKRLKELDTLNKEAIQQATPLPQQGVINATLDIPSGNNIRQLKVKDLSITPFAAHSPYTIQVSSYTQLDYIIDITKQIRNAGFPAFVSTPFQKDGKSWWRIFIGSYPTKAAADNANKELQNQQFPKGVVTHMPYAIQVGDDVSALEAAKIEEKLFALGYLPYRIQLENSDKYRVSLGAFKTQQEGTEAIKSLQEINLKTRVVSR